MLFTSPKAWLRVGSVRVLEPWRENPDRTHEKPRLGTSEEKQSQVGKRVSYIAFQKKNSRYNFKTLAQMICDQIFLTLSGPQVYSTALLRNMVDGVDTSRDRELVCDKVTQKWVKINNFTSESTLGFTLIDSRTNSLQDHSKMYFFLALPPGYFPGCIKVVHHSASTHAPGVWCLLLNWVMTLLIIQELCFFGKTPPLSIWRL